MARKLPDPFGYATATSIDTATDGTVSVRYHRTDVATLLPDGTVTLRTGGWQTVTTKRRINQALQFFNIPARVYAQRREWFVAPHGQRGIAFADGMRIRIGAGVVEVAVAA
jgi:hypothetical protein